MLVKFCKVFRTSINFQSIIMFFLSQVVVEEEEEKFKEVSIVDLQSQQVIFTHLAILALKKCGTRFCFRLV